MAEKTEARRKKEDGVTHLIYLPKKSLGAGLARIASRLPFANKQWGYKKEPLSVAQVLEKTAPKGSKKQKGPEDTEIVTTKANS